jgi:RimJ/RimL family protein N-acetyltransferase
LTVHFYRCVSNFAAASPPLAPTLQVRCWRPHRDGFPPRRSRRITNLVWWGFARLGVFAESEFAEIGIEEDGRLLHRLIVTPAWYRFPFMPEGDLQLGDLWTSPQSRRRHLARTAVAEAHRRFGGQTRSFWYVTEADNHASAALARSCGYQLVAVGRRTRRLGTRLLGQFLIERFV